MWEEMVSPVALSIKDSLWQQMCFYLWLHPPLINLMKKNLITKVNNGLSLLYFLGIGLWAELCLTKNWVLTILFRYWLQLSVIEMTPGTFGSLLWTTNCEAY